jgi:hypothetical protein
MDRLTEIHCQHRLDTNTYSGCTPPPNCWKETPLPLHLLCCSLVGSAHCAIAFCHSHTSPRTQAPAPPRCNTYGSCATLAHHNATPLPPSAGLSLHHVTSPQLPHFVPHAAARYTAAHQCHQPPFSRAPPQRRHPTACYHAKSQPLPCATKLNRSTSPTNAADKTRPPSRWTRTLTTTHTVGAHSTTH